MKILKGIINIIVAVALAAILGVAVRFGSHQKMKQHTGGWAPIDFTELEKS